MASAGTPDLEISSALQKAAGLLGSDPAAAEALIRPVIAADPDNPDARLILGAALRARRAFGEALAVLEPLAADRPTRGSYRPSSARRFSRWGGAAQRSNR